MDFANAVGVISAINECVNFFQWTKSAISSLQSRWSGPHELDIQDHVLNLQSGLEQLRDTLPAMHNLIDGAEWRSHEHRVAEILLKLKDAVYDANDLLDEFRWYDTKIKLEGNTRKPFFSEIFDTVIEGSFSKLNDVQGRLDHLSNQLGMMGLSKVTPRFDKAVRPETSSLPNEARIFGRDKELKNVLGFLGVPRNSKRKRETIPIYGSTSASPSNPVGNESRISCVPVLPIVGIGGVGKTTLAQHICNHQQVKSHFDLVIWICISDDFDVKRLTKEAVESCSRNEARIDNLNSLQCALAEHVKDKRVLIVLDDMWDDALKENGRCWNRFVAPLQSSREGSMMLVTTRCPKVAGEVGTMTPMALEGLKDDIFWNFFKLCAFGSESANNYPQLQNIGRRILLKLKGSPLAAKTLGRMLRMNLQASHWNSILESELWELRQEATDIVPALRLSYMYLPFYLKQCFSFCAVYPKDYKFRKNDLAEIWVAEGFVEPQGDDQILDIGCQYFEDLVARSFFQKVSGQYVIHDLLHDMAQKVSEYHCFILRNKNDFDKVPLNVRHIYVLPNSGVVNSDLLTLCKHTKLRTLICKKQLRNRSSSVMENWCTKLLRIRVISCASTYELPDSIGSLKHLWYLKISENCHVSIPSTFRWLYNLQILDIKRCKIETLTKDFSNLSNLQRFASKGFSYPKCHTDAADNQVQGIRLIKNLNQFRGHLEITNVCMLSKDHAAEMELRNKRYLYELTLKWSGCNTSQIMGHDAVEMLQVLQPPMSLRSLFLEKYPGCSLPSWFQPQNLPNLIQVDSGNNGSIGIFASLTEVTIISCQKLSSLNHFLHPGYIPVIKKIAIENCESLASVPTERFGNFNYLEVLFIYKCPLLKWERGLVLPSSLQTLTLGWCGDFSTCVPGCLENLTSLVSLTMSGCDGITSIPGSMWRSNLALVDELVIWCCPNLVSIGGARAVAKIKKVEIQVCPKLEEAEQIMRRGSRRSSRGI